MQLCYTNEQILYMVYFMSKIIPNLTYNNIKLNNDDKGKIITNGGIGFIYNINVDHMELCIKFFKTNINKTRYNYHQLNDIVYNMLNEDIFVKKRLEI